MFFQVLGDVGVRVDDDWYAISAGRQRAAFCLFALSANKIVGREELVDAIWGESVPQHPDTALHIIVSRLRAAIGPAAARLVSAPQGYRLDVAPEELDYTLAQMMFVRGRALLRDNEPERAAAVLANALACWTGEPFKDLTTFPFRASAYHELRELRASIEETRNDALLAAGRHVEVLATIQNAIAAEPWREQLRRQRMLALYRSGRQVDALREYDTFRHALIEELGVEPSNELSEMHLRILDHDTTLHLPRIGLAMPVPQLTAVSLPFVGRTLEEEFITARLHEVATGASRVVLVEGEPGIGKTRLAMEIARRACESAIVVAATGNDALRPAVVALAQGLGEASLQMSDEELRLCIGSFANELAEIVPALRPRLPDATESSDVDERTRAERLREAVAAWITALSHHAPVVVLLDDVDRAGPGLFLLLGRLFTPGRQQRVLVLATARSRTPERSSRLEQLMDALERQHVLDRIELEGLGVKSVERMLSQLGIDDAEEKAIALHESTGGHPFFLGELVQAGDWNLREVPSSVKEFVRRRVRALGQAEEATLACAAGFVVGFDVSMLAEVADLSDTVATMHINRSLDAGILRQVGVRAFTFVHELTRRAMTDVLDPAHQAALHRRIAVALEGREAGPALLATHWKRAEGPDARAKTNYYGLLAAEDALRIMDPETAVRWFQTALDAADSPADRAHTLLALADAQHQAGNGEAVDSLRGAIALARELGDRELLVACATSWTPIWSSMPPLERSERISTLEDAYAAATTLDTRARLLARLATELAHGEDDDRAQALVREALATTNETSPASVRAEVAMRYFYVTFCPQRLAERRALMGATLQELASDDVYNRCFALSMAAAAAFEAADREAADAALDEMLAIADNHDIPALTLNATTTRALRAALQGDLEDAERYCVDAATFARLNDMATAAIGVSMQFAFIAWQRGRFADLLPLLERFETGSIGPVTRRILTARALGVDDHDAARAVLNTVTTDDLDRLPKGMFWSTTLIAAAEAAFMLGATDTAATVHRLLVPFRGQVAVANFVFAPIAYGAGLAAAAAGRSDSDELFAEAVDVSRRLGAPILRARTEIAWTTAALAHRPRAAHAQEIQARADEARAICEEHRLADLGTPLDPTLWRLR